MLDVVGLRGDDRMMLKNPSSEHFIQFQISCLEHNVVHFQSNLRTDCINGVLHLGDWQKRWFRKLTDFDQGYLTG